MTSTRPACSRSGGTQFVRVAVVTCRCGMLSLTEAMHRTSGQAWTAAAQHVENSRGACTPSMDWDHVPPALAAGLPAAPAQQVGAFVAVA